MAVSVHCTHAGGLRSEAVTAQYTQKKRSEKWLFLYDPVPGKMFCSIEVERLKKHVVNNGCFGTIWSPEGSSVQ